MAGRNVGVVQMTMEQVAGAFSSHRFEEALPQIHDDVAWDLVGGEVLAGKPAVVDVCSSLARDLQDVQTTFDHFRMVSGPAAVVVDSVARYLSADGSLSRVASCDIYDFMDGRVVRIRSYNVELATDTAG